MLWVMLIVYLAQGKPVYPSMNSGTVAFISDIGAFTLKPLFVTGCSITSICFILSLLSMRRNQALLRRLDRVLDLLALLFGFLGGVSLILLSVFDTNRHSKLHGLFLLLFMLGIVLSALMTTFEYRSLGKSFTEHRVLKYSYRGKMVMLVLEGVLSIAFAVCLATHKPTQGAILEWGEFTPSPPQLNHDPSTYLCLSLGGGGQLTVTLAIAFIFTFYILTFFFDLRPKARTRESLRRDMEGGKREAGATGEKRTNSGGSESEQYAGMEEEGGEL